MQPISISKGNKKLNDKIANFSIPPITTCPNAGECKTYCYAKKAYNQYPNVRTAWTRNMDASKLEDFPEQVITELKRFKELKVFRIHVSGDFYNQSYFDKWCKVAEAFPDTTFYTYTKSWHLDQSAKPKNLRVIVSMGGRKDTDIKDIKKRGFEGYTYVTEEWDGKGFKCDGKCGTNCNYCFVGDEFKKVNMKLH